MGQGKGGSDSIFFEGGRVCVYLALKNSQFQTRQYLDWDIQFRLLLEIYIDLMLSWLLEFSKVTPHASKATKFFWNIDRTQAE